MAGMLKTREVAEILSQDPQTIRRWIYNEKLVPTARTPGGQYLFSREHLSEQVEAWTREQKSN